MTAVRAIVTASLVGLVSAHDTDHDALETLAGLVPESDTGVMCPSFFLQGHVESHATHGHFPETEAGGCSVNQHLQAAIKCCPDGSWGNRVGSVYHANTGPFLAHDQLDCDHGTWQCPGWPKEKFCGWVDPNGFSFTCEANWDAEPSLQALAAQAEDSALSSVGIWHDEDYPAPVPDVSIAFKCEHTFCQFNSTAEHPQGRIRVFHHKNDSHLQHFCTHDGECTCECRAPPPSPSPTHTPTSSPTTLAPTSTPTKAPTMESCKWGPPQLGGEPAWIGPGAGMDRSAQQYLCHAHLGHDLKHCQELCGKDPECQYVFYRPDVNACTVLKYGCVSHNCADPPVPGNHGFRGCYHDGVAFVAGSNWLQNTGVAGGVGMEKMSYGQCDDQGPWTDWSSWSECSATCGADAHQTRNRTCNGDDQAACEGGATDTQPCSDDPLPCPVDGVWTDWSGYGDCSLTCGGGLQTRARTCTNPAPAHGGLACVGAPAEDQGCNADTCNTAAEELAGEPGVGGDADEVATGAL